MTYAEYERWLREAAEAASPSARRAFALDTMRLLEVPALDLIKSQLTESEQDLVSTAMREVTMAVPEHTASALKALQESMFREEARSQDFHPYVNNLLDALFAWCKYRRTEETRWIAQIAILMGNHLDHASEIDIHDVLGSPAMAEEFERQRRMLDGASPTR